MEKLPPYNTKPELNNKPETESESDQQGRLQNSPQTKQTPLVYKDDHDQIPSIEKVTTGHSTHTPVVTFPRYCRQLPDNYLFILNSKSGKNKSEKHRKNLSGS